MVKVARILKPHRPTFDRILVDMNTQCALLLPRGAMPVVNRSEVLPNIRRIMSWARVASLPVVSSLECRRLGESARGLPPYCIDGSAGQRKIPITLLPKRIVMQNDNILDVSASPFRRCQQIILIKRSRDFLSNPQVDRLFHALSAHHVVFFGAVVEWCVRPAVMSLLRRGQRVAVVSDACGTWSAVDADLAMRKMGAKGAALVTTEELITGAADERLRNILPVFVPDLEEPAAVDAPSSQQARCGIALAADLTN